MEHSLYFKKLSTKERALALNPGVAGLFRETLASRFVGRILPTAPRETLLVSVGYAYQHYGFCVFSPSAQAFLATSLMRETGLSFEDIAGWLEEVAYALLEDFTILKMLEGEPDWDSVDVAFFRAVAKRTICAEPGETAELGLDCWDLDLIAFLRLVAAEGLESLRAGVGLETLCTTLSERIQTRPDAAVFREALFSAFEELHENPLRLLVWRVECFSSFCDIRQEAKFFVRNETTQVERRAFELAGLLSLLHPHRTEEGVRLLEESPVTLLQLEKAVFGQSRSSRFFDCSLLRNWMDLDPAGKGTEAQLRVEGLSRLQRILEESKRLGLVFELSQNAQAASARHPKKYGLTKAALGILRPFSSSISQALLGR
ncbi:MAG: hypothetical protein IOD12_04335 [Silvanigrellales bacterium]|nr:hypothetical protein [Silvanigrellales bacterium]